MHLEDSTWTKPYLKSVELSASHLRWGTVTAKEKKRYWTTKRILSLPCPGVEGLIEALPYTRVELIS